MDYNYRIAAQILGTLRIQKGLSQAALASRAKLARSHYAMIESGAKKPSVETLWKIVAALDIRLSEFFRLLEEYVY